MKFSPCLILQKWLKFASKIPLKSVKTNTEKIVGRTSLLRLLEFRWKTVARPSLMVKKSIFLRPANEKLHQLGLLLKVCNVSVSSYLNLFKQDINVNYPERIREKLAESSLKSSFTRSTSSLWAVAPDSRLHNLHNLFFSNFQDHSVDDLIRVSMYARWKCRNCVRDGVELRAALTFYGQNFFVFRCAADFNEAFASHTQNRGQHRFPLIPILSLENPLMANLEPSAFRFITHTNDA